MKYVEVPTFGGPEVLQVIEGEDAAPQAGQVAIEVKAAGINFADLMARAGGYPGVKSAPFRPGYEVAGVVSAVGDGVDGLKAGTRVMALVPSGGYTSRAIVDAPRVIPLPDGLDFAPATALLVQGMTAYFLLESGNLQARQNVLIAGAAGGVGSLAVQIARLKGAGKIIGLASPSKHERVRALGADAALDYTKSGWAKDALAATAGQGVHIYLDSQGDLSGEAFDALGEKAHWLVYGGQAGSGSGLPAERMWQMVGKNLTLRGYTLFGDFAQFGRALAELVGWAASGKLQIDAQSFPLADVARAHEAIAHRQTTGKVVLTP